MLSENSSSEGRQPSQLRTPQEFTTELTLVWQPLEKWFYEKSEYEELKYGPKYEYNQIFSSVYLKGAQQTENIFM
jgi:hypothetical protein